MRFETFRSQGLRAGDLEEDQSLLVSGTLPAAILVGLGLGLAVLGLSMASLWQWMAR